VELVRSLSWDHSLPDYCCPVVRLKEQKTVHAQPLLGPDEQHVDHHADALQHFLVEQQEELRVLKDHAQKGVKEFHPNSRKDEETSDYSSHKSTTSSTAPPTPMEEAEAAIVSLQTTILPLEFKAISAVKEKDMEELELLGAQGSPTALTYLAMALESGEGNEDRVLELYRRAAELGHPEAMYNLGVLLVQEGKEDAARVMLQKAADRGLWEARQALGEERRNEVEVMEEKDQEEFYRRGLEWERNGQKEDWIFALELYRMAGEAGHKKAQSRHRKVMRRLHRNPSNSKSDPP